MIYADICAGISASTAAWRPLGWRAAFYSEIDKFASAVLAHRYPDTPNLGDMTLFDRWPDAALDVLIGGTPCQGFSVAGLRKGLDDDRSNLALVFLLIARRYRPRWLVWENVPGARSSWSGSPDGDHLPPGEWEYDETSDLDQFLNGMVELGYGVVVRSLDAQFAGLAQRRERLFVVGYLGDWRPAAAVLLEPESLRGDPPPRREARQDVAGTVAGGARGRGGYSADDIPAVAFGGYNTAGPIDVSTRVPAHEGSGYRCDFDTETLLVHEIAKPVLAGGHANNPIDENLVVVPFDTTQITHPENRSRPEAGDPSPTLAKGGHAQAIAFNARQDPDSWEERAGPLDAMSPQAQAVAFTVSANANGFAWESDVHPTLQGSPGSDTSDRQVGIRQGWAVRRLTPRECERLMGFPDDSTAIPWRGKPAELCPDGPRYKALGNSIAVPCLRWIGERISLCEDVMKNLPKEGR